MRFRILRVLVALLLVTGYLFGTLNYFVPFAEYYLNYEYIVENLCIEREVEESECDGKCHLKVEIDEQQEQDQSPQSSQVPELKQLTAHIVTHIFSLPQQYAKKITFLSETTGMMSISVDVLSPPPKQS